MTEDRYNLRKQYQELEALQEELNAKRKAYQDSMNEYQAKYAKFQVGDRVSLQYEPGIWEVRMVRIGHSTQRIWYTVHRVGDKEGKATLLGEHLTSL